MAGLSKYMVSSLSILFFLGQGAEQDVLMEKYKYLSSLLDLESALNTPINNIITEKK